MGEKTIECTDVEYILALANYHNITKASEALFISQPALSKYLTNLEKRLGYKLFERERGKSTVSLTPLGELYVSKAREIARIQGTLEYEVNTYKMKGIPHLNIGFSTSGIRSAVCDSISEIRKKEIATFSIQELTSQEIEEKLITGELDVGFITLPGENPQIQTHFLHAEEILLGVPSSNPLSSIGVSYASDSFPIINLKDFKDEFFVLRNTGTKFRDVTDAMFRNCGFEPRIAITARNHFTNLEYAESFKLCVLTTKSFIPSLQDKNSFRFFLCGPIPQAISLGVATVKSRSLSPSVVAFISQVQATIASKSF